MSVSPPRPKGPPLTALRAFEAAARLGGFKAAAQELNVTAGAVAQQIKLLEDWTDAPLFERHAQGVRLTQLGFSVRDEFKRAFDLLGGAVQSLQSRARPNHIRIATLPSIAQLWLSPRLPGIRQRNPNLSFSITAVEHRPNLMREAYDLSLFYMDGQLPTGCIPIEQDCLFPVCAPHLRDQIKDVDDLANIELLHDLTWAADWSLWLQQAGAAISGEKGPAYSLYSLALQEAVHGAGILIGHEALVRAHLEEGTLVRPFELEIKPERHLAFELSGAASRNDIVKDVIEMLAAQM